MSLKYRRDRYGYESRPKFKPTTDFGREVEITGFSRVCPVCGEKWSDKKLFMRDTQEFEQVSRKVHEFDAVIIHYRRHHCGGQMGITIGMKHDDLSV